MVAETAICLGFDATITALQVKIFKNLTEINMKKLGAEFFGTWLFWSPIVGAVIGAKLYQWLSES